MMHSAGIAVKTPPYDNILAHPTFDPDRLEMEAAFPPATQRTVIMCTLATPLTLQYTFVPKRVDTWNEDYEMVPR